MEEGQAYPPRMESNCLLPVETRTTFLRWCQSSIAVMNPDAEGWMDLG
jgi:hypothetical protein